MKHKSLLRVLAFVLVLVMSIGILTACNKKPDEQKPTEQQKETKTEYLKDEKSSTAFISTMFSSANKIGQGVSVNTEPGNDIAVNLGLTITLSKNGVEVPVDIYVKGFIDRKNVTEEAGVYSLENNNTTELDICVTTRGIDSLRLYFKMEDGKGVLYTTVAGNNVKVDLSELGLINGEQRVEDYVYNLIEKALHENVIVKSIAEAFNGASFDLNTIISDLVNQLVGSGDKSIADMIFDLREKKETETIGNILISLFGGDNGVRENLGDIINVENLLKNLGSMIFSEPVWKIGGREKDYSYVKTHAIEELESYVHVGGLLDMFLGSSPLKGAIRIGYTKGAGTSADDLGKMEKFYIDINLNNIMGDSDNTLGVKIAITDLKMGSTKDVAGFEALTENYADGFAFDMGFDLTSDEDFMNIITREIAKDTELKVVVGGDKLAIDLAKNTITFPTKLQLNISGNIELFNSENTAIIVKVLAYNADSEETDNMDEALVAQVYGENDDLVADVKVNKDYVYIISDVLDIIYALKGHAYGPLGVNKVGDGWEFNKIPDDVENVLINFVNSGKLRVEGLNLATIINGLLDFKNTNFYPTTDDYGVAAGLSETADEAMTGTFDFLLSSLTENSKGIIATLYKLIKIDDNSVSIGGDNIVSTVLSTLFSVSYKSTSNYSTSGGTITPYVGIGALMEMFANFSATGSVINVIDAYNEFEDASVWALCQGFNTTVDNRFVLLTRGEEKPIDTGALVVEYNADATTTARKTEIISELNNVGYTVTKDSKTGKYVLSPESADRLLEAVNDVKTVDAARSAYITKIKGYGYEVITDKDGVYYAYPKALVAYYNYLVNNDADTKNYSNTNLILAEENVKYENGKLVVKSVAELKTILLGQLNGKVTNNSKDDAYYLNDSNIRQTLKCLLRLGVVIIPEYDGANWTLNESKVFFDDAIFSNADVKLSIYTKKSGNVATRGGVKLAVNFLDNDFTLDLYMNFNSQAGKTTATRIVDADTFYGTKPATALVLMVEPKTAE